MLDAFPRLNCSDHENAGAFAKRTESLVERRDRHCVWSIWRRCSAPGETIQCSSAAHARSVRCQAIEPIRLQLCARCTRLGSRFSNRQQPVAKIVVNPSGRSQGEEREQVVNDEIQADSAQPKGFIYNAPSGVNCRKRSRATKRRHFLVSIGRRLASRHEVATTPFVKPAGIAVDAIFVAKMGSTRSQRGGSADHTPVTQFVRRRFDARFRIVSHQRRNVDEPLAGPWRKTFVLTDACANFNHSVSASRRLRRFARSRPLDGRCRVQYQFG